MKPIRIAVLVSGHGRGTNLQAIIDACKDGRIDGEVAVVVGVRPDAPAMERASAAGVGTVVLNPKEFASADDYDSALLDALTSRRVDLICLAGYMRILGQPIIDAYRNRIMNTHPALIPMFCGKGMYGMHVHEAAIERGVKFSGCTVHLVDEDYDTGRSSCRPSCPFWTMTLPKPSQIVSSPRSTRPTSAQSSSLRREGWRLLERG